jgi:uncharacterized integral membrane protein
MTEARDPTTAPATTEEESRTERLVRHGRRTRLYANAVALVVLLVVLIALIVSNTRQVKLSWVFGDGSASLVWIVVFTAILGWLLGIVTSWVFRHRTKRRRL